MPILWHNLYMAIIKEIKRKRSKSHSALNAALQSALIESRENQYRAVGIVMLGKDVDYTDFFIVPDVEVGAIALLLEELRDEIRGTKYED